MKEVKIIKYIENKRMTKANTMQIIRGNKCEYFRISFIENLWNDLIWKIYRKST